MHLPFLKKALPVVAICTIFHTASMAQGIDKGFSEYDTLKASVVSVSGKVPVALQSSPVRALQKEDIEKLGLHQVYEAVQSFAGASVKDYGGIGGVKTVSVRSLGAQHTSVSYDGVTISNVQSGQVDISRFSLENIANINLTIGQSDNIFQSARALVSAGLLEIFTEKPSFADDKPYNIALTLQASSFNTFSPNIVYQQRLGKNWQMSINGEYLTSKGDYPFTIVNGMNVEKHIRRNDDVNSVKGELNLYGIIAGGDFSFKTNVQKSERGLPGSIVLYNEDSAERLWDDNFFTQASYEKNFSDKFSLKTNIKYSYAWNRYYDESAQYPNGFEDDRYTQNEYFADVILGYKPSEYIFFTIAQDCFENTLDSNIPECQFPKRFSSLTAVSGQYKNERFTATASALGTFTSEKVRLGTAAADRHKLCPSAGISYKLFDEKDLRLRASYKMLYRIPTFNDLYYSRVGNTSLKPERADQYNLGITYSYNNSKRSSNCFIDQISATLDFYYNNVNDKIVAIPTMFIWRMMNMDKVDIKGIDAAFQTRIVAGASMYFDINVNYTLQKAIDISSETAKNYRHQIPYAPMHSGGVQIAWSSPWVNVGYILNAVGDRYSMPQNTSRNLIDGYIEHNISLYKQFDLFGTETLLQAEAVNLTNCMYEVIKYYPMPGRSYRITLKLKL